jgi:hypothetical protein
MVTTTLMPLDPALSPQRIARVLTISADLLPDEIVAARRARGTRTWVLIALGLVVLLLAGWFLQANHQRNDATLELEDITNQTAATQRDQNKYRDVVEVRNDIDALTLDLKTLTVGDLPYSTLLNSLRTSGTAAKVKITGLTATLNSTKTGVPAPVAALPTDPSPAIIGTVVINGTAPDKRAVAAYADKLASLSAVANTYVTSVATTKTAGVTFNLTTDIISAAACGRYTTLCKTTGGN